MSAAERGHRRKRIPRNAICHKEQRQRDFGIGHSRPGIEISRRNQASLNAGLISRQKTGVSPLRNQTAGGAFGNPKEVPDFLCPKVAPPKQHRFGKAPRDFLVESHPPLG